MLMLGGGVRILRKSAGSLGCRWVAGYPRSRVMGSRRDNRCPTCVIIGEQINTARKDTADASARAAYATELVVVALRMLHSAGKLDPVTDDEHAAVKLAGYMRNLPAADRRLLDPRTPAYIDQAVAVGTQLCLGDARP